MSEAQLGQNARIYVAGHRGMVGSAIVRALLAQGISPTAILTRTHQELDLADQAAVRDFFVREKPTHVILAAAKVGGIHANNTYPAEFIYQNLMIQANVIHQAHSIGVERLLFLGSSCIYPKYANQPMAEAELLTGPLEPTNEPYAVAKIAGIKLCESYNRQYGADFRSIMPTNLYGPGDNFDLASSHVVPALIRKIHTAVIEKRNEVEVWGTGKAKREFLHVDDMAQASLHILGLDRQTYQSHVQPMLSHINVGTGEEVSIGELAQKIATIAGYTGELRFDPSRPDGAPRKLLDINRLATLGWRPGISLEQGLRHTYEWYRDAAEPTRH
jgi:nucleoside-diphosphate-sugar epimerase